MRWIPSLVSLLFWSVFAGQPWGVKMPPQFVVCSKAPFEAVPPLIRRSYRDWSIARVHSPLAFSVKRQRPPTALALTLSLAVTCTFRNVIFLFSAFSLVQIHFTRDCNDWTLKLCSFNVKRREAVCSMPTTALCCKRHLSFPQWPPKAETSVNQKWTLWWLQLPQKTYTAP